VDTLRNKAKLDAELVVWRGDYAIPAGTDIVINATSIGLYQPEAAPALDFASLQPSMVVADVVFSPAHTLFLKNAEARGCKTVDGLGMLVNQGAIAIQYWTGIEPDTDVMNQALRGALGL
jgi:shikimate dehydrogenase